MAKLHAPRLASAIPRTRLFRRLDADLRRQRVVWVTAPAGAGKTTLAAGYAAARHIKHLWFQFDPRDADPPTFFYYLREAAAQVSPRARRVLPLLTPEYTFGLSTYTRNFFEQLGALLRSPCLLVFDNYHELPDDAPLHVLLAEGLRVLPESMGVLVLSRNDPPPTFASLHAGRRLALFDADLLALTLPETRALARRYRFAQLTPKVIASLRERTCGWTAGAILMLEEAAQEHVVAPCFDRPMTQAMFSYFAAEVLQRASAAHQRVLLVTALLPQVSAVTARSLTGEDLGGRVLAEFARKGYFVTVLEGREPVYQYHPLFREFLLARLQRDTLPAELALLQRRAAAAAAAAGNTEDAVQLWTDAGAWEEMTTAVLAAAPDLLTQGRWKTLVDWFERLPAPVRDSNPGVAYWRGIAMLPFDPPRARAALSFAYHEFKKAGAVEDRWRAWCGVVDSFVFEWRDFHPLDEWIAEIERGLDSVPAAMDAHVASGMFMALMNRQPQHPDMERWAQRAWDLAIGGADPVLRIKTGPHLLLYYTWWIGDLHKAELLLNALRPYAEDASAPPLVQTTWCAMAGAYYWMNAENPACIAIVERGLGLSDTTGVHVWDMLLCSHGAFATLTSGQLEPAQVYVRRMVTLQDPARAMDSAAYYYLSAYLYYSQGDRARALEHMKTAVDMSEAAGAIYQTGIFRNDYGRMLFYAGDERAAAAVIEQALATSREMRSPSMEYLCYLAQAEIALRRGEEEGCRAALAQCLQIGRQQGYRNHTWWDADLMARLYAKALEHGIEVPYVQRLIRARGLAPPDSGAPENWPWPLHLYTLGETRMVRDDGTVPRLQRKPQEMLQALVALGAREVPLTALQEAIWPEGGGTRAQLDTALYRLRQALGESVVAIHEGRVTLDRTQCWVDVWALERAVMALDTELHRPRVAAAAVTAADENLQRLYRGAFLTNEPAAWAVAPRERMRGRFLRAIAALADYYERSGSYAEAMRCAERALEVDSLAESGYRLLMRAHLARGERAAALGVYHRCRAVLQAALNVPPSPETEALRRTAEQPGG